MTTATPASSTRERKRARAAVFSNELRGSDLTEDQFRIAIYNDPQPSASWMHSYYVCGCGFEQAQVTGFVFHRVPHKCRMPSDP